MAESACNAQSKLAGKHFEYARVEIEMLLEAEPSLKVLVAELVDSQFERAKRLAEIEMGRKKPGKFLTFSEVFEQEYSL